MVGVEVVADGLAGSFDADFFCWVSAVGTVDSFADVEVTEALEQEVGMPWVAELVELDRASGDSTGGTGAGTVGEELVLGIWIWSAGSVLVLWVELANHLVDIVPCRF